MKLAKFSRKKPNKKEKSEVKAFPLVVAEDLFHIETYIDGLSSFIRSPLKTSFE